MFQQEAKVLRQLFNSSTSKFLETPVLMNKSLNHKKSEFLLRSHSSLKPSFEYVAMVGNFELINLEQNS